MEQSVELFLNGVRFRKLFEKEYAELRKQYDLCKIDVQILQYLLRAGEFNTSKDIVDIGMFTKGHVSQSLNRLFKKNMIDMVHDEQDRRCVHILLRGNAKAIVEEIDKVHQRILEIVFQGITEEELRSLSNVAAKITQNISAASDCFGE